MTHDGAGNRLGVTASFPGLTALSGAISYTYAAGLVGAEFDLLWEGPAFH